MSSPGFRTLQVCFNVENITLVLKYSQTCFAQVIYYVHLKAASFCPQRSNNFQKTNSFVQKQGQVPCICWENAKEHSFTKSKYFKENYQKGKQQRFTAYLALEFSKSRDVQTWKNHISTSKKTSQCPNITKSHIANSLQYRIMANGNPT